MTPPLTPDRLAELRRLAGRDYARLSDLQDAIIEAVRTQDGVGGVKAFAAYEDFIAAEAARREARVRIEVAALEAVERAAREWAECPGQHGHKGPKSEALRIALHLYRQRNP